ncbi:MAG TPA: alpha/beta fold hydrolase, partial [Thermoanaerobaculia bacterium]|nr:alpha/beta fold hydrolase [Thermoanaerobaculia bacterium]
LVPHRGIANLLRGHREVYGLGPGDRALQIAAPVFDGAIIQALGALAHGAAVCLPGVETPAGAELAALLRDLAVTEATMPSSLLAGLPVTDLPCLRIVGAAADAPWTGLVDRWSPGRRFLNIYGPTEVTIWATWEECRPGEKPLLGRPIPGLDIYVLGRALDLLPAGVPGELCLGGVMVGRGYLGRPDLTAGKFVPDPFGAEPGARLYRTGDLVRFLPDGRLEFLGRIDRQVKVRGFRVEPGEIEAALAAHPAVREAAVIVRRDGPAEVRLHAFVTGDAGGIRPGELRAWLRERLPEPMIPAFLSVLDALPIGPTGKVDRAALAQQEIEEDDPSGGEAPRTPLEEVVAGLFAEALGRERVGIHASFFDLGGHSLLATRVVARLAAALEVEIVPRLLFEHPTAASLAAAAGELAAGARGLPPEPLRPVGRIAPLPLSFGQERLWFLDQLAAGDSGYGSLSALRLSGALAVDALRRAFDEIVARHEVLRTTFVAEGDQPFQVVAPARPHPLPVIDLSALPAEAREAERGRLLREEAARLFDLARGPLFRTRLLRLAAGEHVLALGHHHVVADGASAVILVRELAALYGAFAAGRPSPLLPLPVQYADFAVWQRRRLAGEGLTRRLAWWRERLGGLPPAARLAPDRPRARSSPSRAAVLPVSVAPATAAALRSLARREGATLFMTLLAGIQALLHRWTGTPAVRVGTPVSNRPLAAEGLVGFFVDTLVLPAEVTGNLPFREHLRRVRETSLGAWAAQDLPFEKLVAALQPGRDAAAVPLFQVMFALHLPLPAPELPGLRVRAEQPEGGERPAPFEISLGLVDEGEALAGGLEVDAALFDEATAAALAADLIRLLDAAAADPDRRIADIPVQGAEERRGRPAAAEADRDDELRSRVAARREGLSEAKRAALARLLRGKGGAAARPAGIPRRSAVEPAPLSFAQERLWFLDRLEPGLAAYNMAVSLGLRGRLDVAALAASFDEIRRRHEVLRTTYDLAVDRPVQVVAPWRRQSLPVIDLAALAASDRDGEARRLVEAEAWRPFDLARGPVVRTSLLRLGEEEHALLWTAHHIAFDGWSSGVLIRELSALYTAFAAGRPSPLPELPVQYADFAAWQRRWLAGDELERQLAEWRRRLAGAAPRLDLPADRPRPTVPSFRGGVVRTAVPRDMADRLAALARESEATLFMVLLAAFQALLARLAGQTDVLVGTPIAGRTRAETEGLIGFFINTLVLRADLAGDPPFRQLLGQVRETTLSAFAHQDLPFEKLVEELAPARDPSRTPFFQVFFNLVNLEAPALDLPGLALTPAPEAETALAKFDLTLYATETPGGLLFDLLYSADLFDRDRIEAFGESWVRLLEQIATDAGRAVGSYPLAPPPGTSPPTPLPSPPLPPGEGRPLPARFREAVRREPERTAVTFSGGSWTYRDLLERSGSIATTRAVTPVCLDRSPELVATVLGLLEAGSAFVLLDPAHPEARREECLRQVGSLAMEGLAYVAFTSGSTGRPKGILGTEAPVAAFLSWYIGRFGLHRGDRFALLSGLSHDPLLRDLLTPLVLGARLSVPAPEVLAEPAAFRAWLAAEGITVLHLTPSTAGFLFRDAAPGSLPAVRLALFGGEPLTWAQAARFRNAAPYALVVNVYGATETPQVMSFYVVEEGRTDAGRVPVGRGRDGVDLLVVNPHGDPCGAGELGEVWIRTTFLTLGYLGDPALTADRFRPDATHRETRVYRTGDLGRYRPDGAVEIAGRADAQIKIRGHRIEPAEIEAMLAAHPDLREAAVAALDLAGEARLVAWIVPHPHSIDPRPILRPWLLTRLPEPMVPSEYVVVEALPRTPNGKLDRRTLPAPQLSGAGAGLRPRDVLEIELARLWEELLGRPVGVRDDFFAAGGHSLLAVRLISEISRRLGRELPLSALFQGPTVERMAVLLRQEGALPPSGLVPLRGGTGRPLFCVHPAGGSVASYAALARELEDRPVWALQARGLSPGEEPRTSIEEMAAAYVEALCSVQAEGPYALLGWSLGGLIAYEMALQLAAAGERVEPLVLLDTWGRDRRAETELPSDEAILLAALADLLPLAAEELSALPAESRAGHVLQRAREAGALPPDFGPEEARRYLGIYKANLQASLAYRPAPYPGNAVLFRAEDGPESDAALGWDERIQGDLTVIRLPGTHSTLIEPPQVEAIAAWLRVRGGATMPS